MVPSPLDKKEEVVPHILAVLGSQTGRDFTGLKRSMLVRRIERRRTLHGIASLEGYLAYLEHHDAEAQLLCKDLLIGVTNFFRDSDAWDALKSVITSELLAKPLTKPLRIWDVGCSSGEEAYSLAMILEEAVDEMGDANRPEFQIFATDIDADAINVARQGVYAPTIARDVSAERIARFFTNGETHYRVKEYIRQRIVFAVHDVGQDAPCMNCDLIVCRNLLIFFTPELQHTLIQLFHQSLNPDGILFLGSSESISTFKDCFTPFDSKWKIFTNTHDVVR